MLYVLWEISYEWYIWKGFKLWSAWGTFFLIGGELRLGDFFPLFCLLTLNLSIQEQLCETNTNLLYFLKTILAQFPTTLVLTFYKLVF